MIEGEIVVRIRALLATAVAVVAVGGLTACADDTTTSLPPAIPTTAQTDSLVSPVDVAFLEAIVPHHQQTVTMTDQATTRAASPQVKDLAARIGREQTAEVDQGNQLLDTLGQPRPQAGSLNDVSEAGMFTPPQLDALAATAGAGFDRMFLQMMIKHHEGGVSLSQSVLGNGQNPQVKQFATAVAGEQQREIGEMRALLGP